jgi:hypothetical protein
VPSPPSSPLAPLSSPELDAPASPPLDLGAEPELLLPLLLLLLPLLLPLLLLLDAAAVGSMHEPFSQASEQQSPKPVHEAPLLLQLAPAPPHTPLEQSLLQHVALDVHDSPSAEQLGAAHVPLTQLPLQQSLDEEQLSPATTHSAPDAVVPLGAMHTPEQARLQQSDHEAHVTPTAVQAPPAPPSPTSHASVAGALAQPMKMATRVPRVIDVVSFMFGAFATHVPPRPRRHLLGTPPLFAARGPVLAALRGHRMDPGTPAFPGKCGRKETAWREHPRAFPVDPRGFGPRALRSRTSRIEEPRRRARGPRLALVGRRGGADMRASWLRGLAGIGLCAAMGAMACGPRRDGGFASASTPRALPLGVFPASAIMTQKYGIVEWRFFSGRSQRVVTGYRADGSAARGVQLAWFPKTPTSEGHLRMLMLDGSGTAVRRTSSGSVTGSLTPLQAEVLVYSAYDAVRYGKEAAGTVEGQSADPGAVRFHPLDVPQNAQSCGNQLSGTWTNGVSCAEGVVGAPATVIWGLIENLPGEVQGNLGGLDQKLTDSIDTPCLGFFNNYANSLSACAPAGCVIDPGGPMVCGFDSGTASTEDAGTGSSNDDAAVASNDDAAAGGDDASPGAGDDGGDPGAGDDGGDTEVASGDDGGSGAGDDSNGDDGGASNGDDPPTDQEIQTASNDSSCLSCQGSASDLSVNPENGDVSPANNDPGAGNDPSATSDTSDPPGGSSGSSGGADNGGSSSSTGSSSSSGGQASEDQSSEDQASQDQPAQDQGQGTQDTQPSQDQGSQDQSQDQSQDDSAIRRRHHGHKPSGWRRLYDRIQSWLAE